MNGSNRSHLARRSIRIGGATLALVLALPGTVGATYPGSTDGRLAIGSTVGGNVDIYTVLPNGEALHRLTTDRSSTHARPGLRTASASPGATECSGAG